MPLGVGSMSIIELAEGITGEPTVELDDKIAKEPEISLVVGTKSIIELSEGELTTLVGEEIDSVDADTGTELVVVRIITPVEDKRAEG